MADNFIGRFYFKLTDSKNLIGEFSNPTDTRIYAESADRIIPDVAHGNFVGEYYHTWCQYNDPGKQLDGVEGVVAKLTIKEKTQNIFTLKWDIQNDLPNDKHLWGEGMLCDGMLIGDYRNFEDSNNIQPV
jgi:hypothetical protein